MLHEKAVAAAMNAAFAVSESETWMYGLPDSGGPSKKAGKAWAKEREDWLGFAREHKDAPAEALWIRAGALGIHDRKLSFAELAPLVALAFQTFQTVLNMVCDALDRLAAEEAARIEAEKRAEIAAARANTPPNWEGTAMEPLDDPMAPSAFARPAPAKAEGEETAAS